MQASSASARLWRGARKALAAAALAAALGTTIAVLASLRAELNAQPSPPIFNGARARLTSPQITAGSGAGITVDEAGEVRRQTYKVTVASTGFVCAATTCDLTIATFPAKTKVYEVVANLATTFACASVCTSTTLSMTAGAATAGDAGLLVSFDADAAAGWFGDADEELGTRINRASAVQGGYYAPFAATEILTIRLTSGTGNIGNGSVTNLSQGSITFYVTTDLLP